MLYLKQKDFNSYSYIVKYYGLKDFDDPQHKKFKRFNNYEKIPPRRTKVVQIPLKERKT
jgi:hypothetical protein